MTGSFEDHLNDLFAPLGGVTLRKMFGGLGIFREGVMFGPVADETLHLKVDAVNQPDFESDRKRYLLR